MAYIGASWREKEEEEEDPEDGEGLCGARHVGDGAVDSCDDNLGNELYGKEREKLSGGNEGMGFRLVKTCDGLALSPDRRDPCLLDGPQMGRDTQLWAG